MAFKKNLLVSIVLPTYNRAKYLDRAIQSVLDQTYTYWELIVIDNYSTDNTYKVISKFNDPRIFYLKRKNNGVIAKSRNIGIRAAKGQWIAFLDSDDWWVNNKLKTCVDSVCKKTDLIYHDLKIISNNFSIFGRKIAKSRQLSGSILIDLLQNGNALSTSSVMVRKKVLKKIGGMNESSNMASAEDYNTWLKIAKFTDQFKYIPLQLGFYQKHSQGFSSQIDTSIATFHASSEFLNVLNRKQKNKFDANLAYTAGRFNYLSGNHNIAKKNLLTGFRYGRFSIKLKSILMLLIGFLCS